MHWPRILECFVDMKQSITMRECFVTQEDARLESVSFRLLIRLLGMFPLFIVLFSFKHSNVFRYILFM